MIEFNFEQVLRLKDDIHDKMLVLTQISEKQRNWALDLLPKVLAQYDNPAESKVMKYYLQIRELVEELDERESTSYDFHFVEYLIEIINYYKACVEMLNMLAKIYWQTSETLGARLAQEKPRPSPPEAGKSDKRHLHLIK